MRLQIFYTFLYPKALAKSQLMPTRPAIKQLQGFLGDLLETEDKSHLLIKVPY
jgi:hypothetical protein